MTPKQVQTWWSQLPAMRKAITAAAGILVTGATGAWATHDVVTGQLRLPAAVDSLGLRIEKNTARIDSLELNHADDDKRALRTLCFVEELAKPAASRNYIRCGQ